MALVAITIGTLPHLAIPAIAIFQILPQLGFHNVAVLLVLEALGVLLLSMRLYDLPDLELSEYAQNRHDNDTCLLGLDISRDWIGVRVQREHIRVEICTLSATQM
jgi:hypothetical protein